MFVMVLVVISFPFYSKGKPLTIKVGGFFIRRATNEGYTREEIHIHRGGD